MIIKKLCMASIALGFAALTNCGGDDEDEPGTVVSSEVGGPCSASSECTGYAKPTCVSQIKPLENLVTSTDPKHQPFRDLTIPIPGGYCSTSLADSCSTDAECGSGACFRAFEGVPDATIENLTKVGLPFDIRAFSNLGICMKPCQSNADCRTGQDYECLIPLTKMVNAINPDYTKKFCIQDVNVDALLL